MKKMNPAELFAEKIFKAPEFQEKWKTYLEAFGNDIELLFPEKYKTRVTFASVLQKIFDEKFEEALSSLKGFFPSCSSEEETKILSRLTEECKKKILPVTEPQKSERYRRYRETLLSKGFSEAKRQDGHFFRKTTEKVAFAVNLDDEEFCVTVVYGFTVIPTGGEEWFAENGADTDTCHIRNILCACDETGENEAGQTISDFYHQYKNASKDEILALKKEREKAFLAHFAVVLKPLGFKKKRTKWTKELDGERALSFEAQKSAYSDQYYFNVTVHSVLDFYERKSYERVVMHDRDIYNWQLMTEEQIKNLVQCSLKEYIEPELKKWSENS